MCMLLHLSFKKIVPFVLKVVIWALKAKKWPCPPLPINAQNTVKKLGIDLSFSSSLVCAGFRRKKLTYLSYHPTFSVEGCEGVCRDMKGSKGDLEGTQDCGGLNGSGLWWACTLG